MPFGRRNAAGSNNLNNLHETEVSPATSFPPMNFRFFVLTQVQTPSVAIGWGGASGPGGARILLP